MVPASRAAQRDPYARTLKPLEKFIPEVMADWQVPGLAISIIKDGRLIYAKGFGFRDVDGQKEVTAGTLFAIGSCTKAFTSASVGMLVDEGKVDWDERVTTYLPRFKLKDDFATARMTPRDLLCHRSGLPRHDLMWYNSSATREELFSRLQYLEPSQDFRTHYQYQNLMFMTAGYLVEQLTGMTWEKFIESRIFYPLGMTDSNFSVEDSKREPDHALPYELEDKKVASVPFRNIDTIGPAGSINSNVTDMANWVLLNLSKGKFGDQAIVSEASLREIHSPQMISGRSLRYDETFYSLYGMGWGMTSYRGHVLLSHGGGIDGFTALVSLMPRDEMGLVILTNLGGNPAPQAVMYQVYDLLLDLEPVDWNGRFLKQREEREKEAAQAEEKEDADRVAGTSPSLALEAYAGDYSHPGYGVLKVSHRDDSLEATYNAIVHKLEHYHYDVFKMENKLMSQTFKVAFALDLKGNVGSISVPIEPAVEPIVFSRMPEETMRERAFLELFTGEFQMEQVTLTILLKKGDTLFVQVPGLPEYELVPYKGTQFTLKGLAGVSIEFIRDETGAVTGAKITQPEGVFNAKKK
jgi:CubicO group peptidase (beta-lactamase class C family)